jgi:hypothetical protein
MLPNYNIFSLHSALGQWRRTPTASPQPAAGDVPILTRGLKDNPNNIFFSYLLSQFFATGHWCDYDGNHTWIITCLTKEEEHPTSKLATESLPTLPNMPYQGAFTSKKRVVRLDVPAYSSSLLSTTALAALRLSARFVIAKFGQRIACCRVKDGEEERRSQGILETAHNGPFPAAERVHGG